MRTLSGLCVHSIDSGDMANVVSVVYVSARLDHELHCLSQAVAKSLKQRGYAFLQHNR